MDDDTDDEGPVSPAAGAPADDWTDFPFLFPSPSRNGLVEMAKRERMTMTDRQTNN
jgi:hypothetical protein